MCAAAAWPADYLNPSAQLQLAVDGMATANDIMAMNFREHPSFDSEHISELHRAATFKSLPVPPASG
jgi:hypothetical protein